MRGSFSADLSKFGVTVDKRLTKAIRLIVLAALKTVQAKNPVLTGWSAGNWQVSANKPGIGVYSYYAGSWVSGNRPQGNRPMVGTVMPIPPQKDFLPMLYWKDKVYLTNNTPYIGFVEERAGMLRATLAETRANLRTLAYELSK